MTRAFVAVPQSVSGHLMILLAMLSFGVGTLLPRSVAFAETDDFPKAFNTDPPDSNPPSPEEMVKLIQLPPGFNVTLFAGEPDVQQPICMDFDDKGRLWVAECYTYSGGPYETKLRDRVIILEEDLEVIHEGSRRVPKEAALKKKRKEERERERE